MSKDYLGLQLEVVDDARQESMNEKINLKLIEISEDIKLLYSKIEDIELRLDDLENP